MRKIRTPQVEETRNRKAKIKTDIEIAKIKELVGSGLSLSKAAKITGIEYKRAKRLYAFGLDSEDGE